MVSELALFQVAAVAALVGMALGWRGVTMGMPDSMICRLLGIKFLHRDWRSVWFIFRPVSVFLYTAIIKGKRITLH